MKTLIEVESLLADKLSIIKEGQGDWAMCIQAIEDYGNERAATAYSDAASTVYTQSRNRPANPDELAKTFLSKAAAIRKGSV